MAQKGFSVRRELREDPQFRIKMGLAILFAGGTIACFVLVPVALVGFVIAARWRWNVVAGLAACLVVRTIAAATLKRR